MFLHESTIGRTLIFALATGMTVSLQKALTDGLLQMKANLAAEAPSAGKTGGAVAPISAHDTGGAARRERHA